tara:strand:- start:304 stop:858 length:555 start_codon:yes stop_codon:yes gene_type:complete
MASFWDTVTDYAKDAIDIGADFFLGDEVLDPGGNLTGDREGGLFSDIYDFGRGVYNIGESFLGSDVGSLVKKGANMYLDSQREPTLRRDTRKMERPRLIRGSNQPTTAARTQPRNPIGLNNPAVRSAVQRMQTRNNFSPQLQRIVEANMTARQGRRTIGVGSTQLARVTPVAAASVRKVAKETT